MLTLQFSAWSEKFKNTSNLNFTDAGMLLLTHCSGTRNAPSALVAIFNPTQAGPMANVTIYTTMFCPYCTMAKRLLKQKGIEFEEIDVTMSPDQREAMTELAGGRRTVPQIFIDERHIGGNDDLQALEARGELDPLLAG